MMPEHKLKLKLDQEDVAAINEAIDRRLLLCALPFGGGNREGRAIAEICRGWLEILGHKHKPALTPAEKDEAEGNAALEAFRKERDKPAVGQQIVEGAQKLPHKLESGWNGTALLTTPPVVPSPKPFIAGQEYRTRDGHKARIYATDGGGRYPVQGAVLAGDGQWDQQCWGSDGGWYVDGAHNLDLMPLQ